MSRITFESKERTVEVRGSERFHAAYLIEKITAVFLDLETNQKLLAKAIPASHYLNRINPASPQWANDFEMAFRSGLNLEVDGKPISSFILGLNTASAVGGDAIKLLARIHGQSEIHGYVAGKNRHWMADIIENAPADVLRPNSGWEDLVELLRESEDGPVVMSYSITENFLSTVGTDWVGEVFSQQEVEDEEAVNENGYTAWEQLEEDWDDLDSDTKWDYAMKWLEANGSSGLEITPDVWPISFGYNGMTAGKLIEELQKV